MGCAPDDAACIEDAQLWQSPPAGLFCVRGDLVVQGRAPEDLAVLARVEAIEGSLVVHDNAALAELPAWPALVSIGGSLSISHNAVLTAVRGFPVLEDLSGGLYVAENPALVELELGEGVTAVEMAFITLNPSLRELQGLSRLTEVASDLRVTHNAGLLALELPALRQVGGDLLVTDNPSLRSAELPALRAVETLSIVANASLESLAGFSALEAVKAALIEDNDALEEIRWTAPGTSWLMITDNARLERIDGAASSLTADGRLHITLNPALQTVTGFGAVESLAGLMLEENEALPGLAAFSALARIGDLAVVRNAAFTGPDAWFPALAEVSGNLSMYGNLSLLPVTADSLLARITVGGEIRVGDNLGEDTELDPCPWSEDGICDAATGWLGRGTELCVIDPEDCGTV
ncbi:hypothetical protein OV203_15970 [Nannocystis sp. ILAH1]|uniref:hypothetical protein n=1 Tax=Nannocystis sp. ILAH1 TaxID=2996789 RepID=UPI00226FEA08|nr:hypothetical protein [Nannocystis sp. ILAH1]MCY0988631.1 hypothetical protein [Nannocystis sp. ILAH1]